MGTLRQINGVCPHDCPDGCGVRTGVDSDGRAITFEGQKNHPVTRGWLCAKVATYLDRVYHPDRLTVPLKRAGPKGSGQFRKITWSQAIAEITTRWRGMIGTFGAEAILPYSYSGTLGLVQMTVASARFWNRLGASQLERSICMAATRQAVRATLGARMSPPYHHVVDSNLLIFWGHNPVSTAPHLMPFVQQAKKRGCRIIVIDPCRTRTAKMADLHIRPLPGTDMLIALGIAHYLVEHNLHDAQWLERHTTGWPLFRQHIKNYPLDEVAAIADIPPEQLVTLAQWLANHRPSMIRLGDGINRHAEGGQTVRAICCLPALTGQYGIRGGGLGCSTGDYFSWNEEAINKWDQCPAPGRRLNMNRLGAVLTGEAVNPPVQSLFVFCANPMVSAPNTCAVQSGLQRQDLFTVVHDLFMTDTARYADIVLPATSQLEHTDLHRGYGHTHLSYNHKAIEPVGQSKSNWAVMRLLAEAMQFSDPWLHQTEDEVIQEIFEATRQGCPRLGAISLSDLMQSGFVPYAREDEVPFHDLNFPTPSGKVTFVPLPFTKDNQDALPTWKGLSDKENHPRLDRHDSLHLISPAAHHFVNSSLANLPRLINKESQPSIVVHPEDATRRGIRHNSQVTIYNSRGICVRKLIVSEQTRRGVAVAVTGFWDQADKANTINRTTSDRLGDMAGQSTFHTNRVWLKPI